MLGRTVSYMDPKGAYMITKSETVDRFSAVATRRSEVKNLETILETSKENDNNITIEYGQYPPKRIS